MFNVEMNANDTFDTTQREFGGNSIFGDRDNLVPRFDGKDILTGTADSEVISGSEADDRFFGSSGNDTLDGLGGENIADYSSLGTPVILQKRGLITKVGLGEDRISNIETIVGASGQDNSIDGVTGATGVSSFDIDLSKDKLTVRNIPVLGDLTFTVKNFVNVIGTNKSDSIIGNEKDNSLVGAAGDDTLTGGFGNDTLTGNEGSDIFVIGKNGGVDTISDFELNADKIGLADGLTFADLDLSGNSIFNDGALLANTNILTEELTGSDFV